MVGHVLIGRDSELGRLRRLIADADDGHGAALVLWGGAGIGRSAMIEEAITASAALRVVTVNGVESEAGMEYGALHRVLHPYLSMADNLPAPQLAALEVIFGRRTGPAPSALLVGLATLGVVSRLAKGKPVLLVADDAQWLDRPSARALAFVGRRISGCAAAMLLSVREPTPRDDVFAGLPELRLSGLSFDDSITVLLRTFQSMNRRVAERVAHASAGNPMALYAYASELSDEELVGNLLSLDALPLGPVLESQFTEQVRMLSPGAQQLLLLAAADQSNEPQTVQAAAASLNIIAADLRAEVSPYLALHPSVRFKHPMIGAAVYGATTTARRREAHLLLAGASDPAEAGDLRAWHLAAATTGPDGELAALLEQVAAQAVRRSGRAVESAYLSRAAELSPDPLDRARRLLAAAESALLAVDRRRAGALITQASPLTGGNPALEAMTRRATVLMNGRFRYYGETIKSLIEVARDLAAAAPAGASETWDLAFELAMSLGPRTDTGRVQAAAGGVLRHARRGAATSAGILREGYALTVTRDEAAGYPVLKKAFRSLDLNREGLDSTRISTPVSFAALDLWDVHRGLELLTAMSREAARRGERVRLIRCQLALFRLSTWAGRLDDAERIMGEGEKVITSLAGPPVWLRNEPLLRAWRGDSEPLTVEYSSRITRGDVPQSMGGALFTALAAWCNARGQYGDASGWASRVTEPGLAGATGQALAELVEAAQRGGERPAADSALRRLTERAALAGTDWSNGVLARCRAMLADQADAEALYRESVRLLTQARMPLDLGRAHLLFGEWLRRDKRRSAAAEQLRAAVGIFTEAGAQAFAERAAAELKAAGGSGATQRHDALTPQEAQIAALAAAGLTNSEVAGQLYLSGNTVAYHLRKVFTKLGVSSRRELRGLDSIQTTPGRPTGRTARTTYS